MLEAEIFGCEKGAFTGAVTASEISLMEMADIRTRFLDEESTDQAPGKADARPGSPEKRHNRLQRTRAPCDGCSHGSCGEFLAIEVNFPFDSFPPAH